MDLVGSSSDRARYDETSCESKKSTVTRGESVKSPKAERTYRATRFARDASRRVARTELIARRREYSTR